VPAGDTSFPEPTGSVRLLPEYDAYVMGFRARDVLVPPTVRELVMMRPRGRYEGPAGLRFVLVDGVTAGLWDRLKRGKRIAIHVSHAERLDELRAEVTRIGAFLGLEPDLTID
jgi:hypothetical protein